MNKLIQTFAFVLLITNLTYAQEDGVFDRINGVHFGKSIFIYLKPDRTFQYSTDEEKPSFHDLDDGSYFNVKNKNKNDVTVYIKFYNPLKTSLKSTQKDLDDPAYQALSDFISKLPSGTTTDVKEKNDDKASINDVAGLTPLNVSILLNEWIYKFQNLLDATYVTGNLVIKFNDVAKTLNNIETTERYLFGGFGMPTLSKGSEKERSLADWVKFSRSNLYNSGDEYQPFLDEWKNSNQVQTEIEKYETTAASALKNVEKLLTEGFDKDIALLIGNRTSSEIDAFKKYSLAFARTLVSNTKSQMDINKTVSVQHKSFIDKTKTFCDEFKGTTLNGLSYLQGFKEDHYFKLDWKSKTMKKFTYDSKGLNEDGSEDLKSAKTTSFIVSKKLAVYPFISTGVLYTNFKYPIYAVSENGGVKTVTKVKDEKVYTRPTVFLNLLISSWDPVYPFGQLGITSGNGDVLFPVGVGLSFGKSFSISGGAILGYHDELNKLKENGTVKDDAELKADLTKKGIAKGYFSVNYNFGKK